MFFSKIEIFLVLEEQINENPTSHLTCTQFGVSPNYSKNFKELRQQEDGFFVNGSCQLKLFNCWLSTDRAQDFFLIGA